MHNVPGYPSQVLSLALKASNSGIWDWDMSGDTVTFDPNYYRMAGYEPNEFPHKFEEWERRVHPDDLPSAQKAFEQYMAGNTENYSAEFRFKTKAGDWMWMLTKGEVTERDENGNPTRFTGLHIDISQIKNAENKFQKERAFNTSLIDTAQLIILLLDRDGRISRINPYMEALTGYKEAEVKGKDWFDTFLPPADHKMIRARFKKAIADIDVRGEAYPIVAKDGRELMIEWHSKTLKDANDTIIGLLSFGVDITERVQTETALQESEKHFWLVFENAPVALSQEDFSAVKAQIEHLKHEGVNNFQTYLGSHPEIVEKCAAEVKIIDVNRAALKLFNANMKQQLQEGLHKIFTEESFKVFSAELVALANGAHSFHAEATIKTLDGEKREVLLQLFIDPHRKNWSCVYVSLTDITSQKNAEERLELATERERELADIVRNAPIAIAYGYPDGRLENCNNAFSHLVGYSLRELKEVNWNDVLTPSKWQALEWEKLNQLSPAHTSVHYEKEYIHKDGTIIPIELTVTANFDSAGNIINFIGFILEISERKKFENQLRQKHKMEAVGYMAGGIAHNFNNNLSIILGNVELSQMKQVPGSESIQLLENAKIAVRRSRDLVQKIITYSRKGMQSKVPTKLTEIINETITLLQATLPTTIRLQKKYSSNCHTKVINADPSQIQEVLVNLCNNAVQAMQEKGNLTISLETVELQEQNISAQYECLPGHYAKISFQDSGCGMPAQMLDKIFDPFFTTKEEYEGAGMGLSTVQGIVAQHGGMIKVDSQLNHGTTFELYFPLLDLIDNAESEAEEPPLSHGTECVLFVDDDEIMASLGEYLLSTLGYRVSMMTDSTEALKMFTANADRFDLVITDQTMPQLTGTELIAEVKKVKTDIPTILCTGYSSKIDEAKAAELGISAFMMKPFDLPVLSQTIRQVLEGDKEK